MNEIVFIDENKESWRRLNKAVSGTLVLSADEMITLYIQVCDDLSYARTHFPESRIVKYLNAIVLNAHRLVYKNRYGKWSSIKKYWTEEIPLAIYRSHRQIGLAFLIFFISIIIGCFSSATDPNFVRIILGDSYVNMTLNNIEKGDPMAVYSTMEQSSMFLGIGANNIRVSFLAFALGIFTALGTSMIIFINGVMVGAFFYFFFEKGIAALAWTTIMIHGTLELSAIAIAGGAGIVLGHSFLFPGTYTRGYSLRKGAADAIKIVIGLIPVFIAAAFLESYLTREYKAIQMIGRVTVIALSSIFMWWYFYFLPKRTYERTKFSVD